MHMNFLKWNKFQFSSVNVVEQHIVLQASLQVVGQCIQFLDSPTQSGTSGTPSLQSNSCSSEFHLFHYDYN